MICRRTIGVGGAVLTAAAILRAQATPLPQPPQTFRASTDVVMVDVAVRADDRAVAGLTTSDFVLTDNGVRQVIESIETTAVPIDVTLVVDVSGNPSRPWRRRADPRAVAAALDQEVRTVTALLRPTDRIRLLAIDSYVQQLWPFKPMSDIAPIASVEVDGLAAVFETLAAALLQPVEPARRHVVIARTKGIDTISAIDAPALRAIAEQSDALLHVVLMETALANDAAAAGSLCGPLPAGQAPPPFSVTAPSPRSTPDPPLIVRPTGSLRSATNPDELLRGPNAVGLCWPTSRSWMPVRRDLISGPNHAISPQGLVVKAGVEATGGRWHQASEFGEPSLAGTFRDAFENFRTNYVLRYTPRGVRRAGWHAIDVTIPRFRDYRISARKGYGIDELPPAPPPPAPVAIPRTLQELTVAYDRGAYQSFASSLRQMGDTAKLVKEFEAAGNPWPATPGREAAFVLELVEPSLFSARLADRQAAHRLLERFTRLVRDPLEPVMFERYWHFAVLTQLQGSMMPSVAAAFADRALDRFPTEPQFLLARAIVADQAAYSNRMRGNVAQYAADDALVPQYYEAALAHPETSVEARIRLAWHLHRAGRAADAMARLREAGNVSTTDPALRYLRELFLGFVLESQNQPAPAIAAYRTALAMMPTAQSARVALMNALANQGQRAESEALAEQIQSEPGRNIVDPWWMYWQGQYRFHPQVMARVREMAR